MDENIFIVMRQLRGIKVMIVILKLKNNSSPHPV